MHDLLDLETYPIDQPESVGYKTLVRRCRRELEDSGMYNLEGLMLPSVCQLAAHEVDPVMQSASFTHHRKHNIYFLDKVSGIDAAHPALRPLETVNHTICGDQIPDSIVVKVYQYEPLIRFIGDTMNKNKLYLMEDPLARVNVMAYRKGEALNWHFDRSEFTTTLLLQTPQGGGQFEYRTGLRDDHDPNYEGVAHLLNGDDPAKQKLSVSAGTLNVFRGKNTAHRVTPVQGNLERLIAVFSYYEYPGKMFSAEERLGFYGRVN